MFQDKQAAFAEYPGGENHIGKFCQLGVVIGWIGKDDVKGLVRFLEIAENVSPDRGYIVHLQVAARFLNEPEVGMVHLNGYHRADTPGGEFISNTACPCKEVKDIQAFKIQLMNQDVKQVLLCKIGGWS